MSWPAGKHRPYSYQAGTIDGTAALSGAFWGMLFGGLFLMPLADPDPDPDAAAARPGGLARTGLSDDLLQELRRTITPGTSALFLLAGKTALHTIREGVEFSRSDPLVTTLGDGPGEGPAARVRRRRRLPRLDRVRQNRSRWAD